MNFDLSQSFDNTFSHANQCQYGDDVITCCVENAGRLVRTQARHLDKRTAQEQ